MKKGFWIRKSTISLKFYAKKGDIQNKIALALTTTPTNLGISKMHYRREASRKRKMISSPAATPANKNPRKKEVPSPKIPANPKQPGSQESPNNLNSLENKDSQDSPENRGKPKVSSSRSRRKKTIK